MTETVSVMRRTRTGRDGMGEPTYEWDHELVPGCLVNVTAVSTSSSGFGNRNSVLSSGDDAYDRRYEGTREGYTVAFPKRWTRGKPDGYLRNARVAFVDRGMDAADPKPAYVVTGRPAKSSASPVPWDLMAEVWRANG